MSLTCLLCKCLEHILVSNIMDHLDQHKLLVDYQHGFRARHSCETQLLAVTDDHARALDAKQKIDMAVLDFSKAFDKVPHTWLLKKAEH